jgi:4-carboxymuconolactone decarboxylase
MGPDRTTPPEVPVPETPRLAPTTEADLDERTAALVEQLGGLNIFRTLAHHPDLLRGWLGFGAHVLMGSTLDARIRELAILRTGWRCRCEYEFGHHTTIGAEAGITDAELRRVTEGPEADGWTEAERAVLAAVDELVDDHTLSDATWAQVSSSLDTRQLLDLIFTVGQYALVSMALNSCRVAREDGVPGFPT